MKPALFIDNDMSLVGMPKQIVVIPHDFLVGADQEYAQIVRLSRIPVMQL